MPREHYFDNELPGRLIKQPDKEIPTSQISNNEINL